VIRIVGVLVAPASAQPASVSLTETARESQKPARRGFSTCLRSAPREQLRKNGGRTAATSPGLRSCRERAVDSVRHFGRGILPAHPASRMWSSSRVPQASNEQAKWHRSARRAPASEYQPPQRAEDTSDAKRAACRFFRVLLHQIRVCWAGTSPPRRYPKSASSGFCGEQVRRHIAEWSAA